MEDNFFHLGCFDGGRLLGSLILEPIDEKIVKMRQVAISPRDRQKGLGRTLVHYAETFAREKGCILMVAHARETAVPFYQKLGYSVLGPSFIRVTIPHRLVLKDLVSPLA